ncbi:MAG: hypothetical protein ACOX5R_08940 [bacterium]
MMRHFALFLLLFATFSSLMAQDYLGDVVVVTDADDAQMFPDVAYNSKENTFLVVWEHAISDTSNDIYGVILDGDTAQPVGNPQVLIMDDAGFQSPEVTYNSTDNEFALIARRIEDEMFVLQRVGANGQPLGEPVELAVGNYPIFDPHARARGGSITYNAQDHEYLVGITTSEVPSPLIVMSDGSLDLPVEPFGNGTNPSVAWSSVSNVYLLAWEDRELRDAQNEQENLSAQLISSDGDLIGDVLLVRHQPFAEESPRVAYNPDDDQFLVIWDERIGYAPGGTTQTDLFGQIISAAGQLVGEPIPIEFSTAYTLRQDVAYSPQSGRYLVVWKGEESGDWRHSDIYGRFINRDGTPDGEHFLIVDSGDDGVEGENSEQYFDESKLPAVAFNSNTGTFLVVWEEGGIARDPLIRDIHARFVKDMVTGISSWELF